MLPRHWVIRGRIVSGLVLFIYAATHLLVIAHGIGGLGPLAFGAGTIQAAWSSTPGRVVLYAALAVHVALVLVTLFARRTLRMPRREALQIVLGVLIVPLMVTHVVGTGIVSMAWKVDVSYPFVLALMFVQQPLLAGLQTVGVLVTWSHGCIGMHHWLKVRPWYPRAVPWLYAGALLLPVLALQGMLSAGREVAVLAQDPAWVAAMMAEGEAPADVAPLYAWVYGTAEIARDGMLALLVGTFAARGVRSLAARRHRRVRITYPSGRTVAVTAGTTVLEASRLAGIPHASMCGGRGRCSTCRVSVRAPADALPPPGEIEARVLDRIGIEADEPVRLACQLAPTDHVAVTPLLPPDATIADGRLPAATTLGREREIVVLFTDLRGFTAFAEQRLPFDVVFVLNQYFRAIGQAVEAAGGTVDKFIGDGVMALFGLDTDVEDGARRAFAAARAMGEAMERLNRDLAAELDAPLRIGIGLHSGPAIVGRIGYGPSVGLTAIGDTVNIASRCESLCKDLGVELVASRRVVRRAGLVLPPDALHRVEVRGRAEPLPVYAVPRAVDLPKPA
jgi:adenylate cyclase